MTAQRMTNRLKKNREKRLLKRIGAIVFHRDSQVEIREKKIKMVCVLHNYSSIELCALAG